MLGITNSKNEPISTENSAKLIHRKFKGEAFKKSSENKLGVCGFFSEYQHNVSFCLAPIYGKEPKWLHFAELVEHYKLQGVNKFFIYIREIGEYDMKLVKSYVASGEVEIIEVPATNSDVIAQQMMAVAVSLQLVGSIFNVPTCLLISQIWVELLCLLPMLTKFCFKKFNLKIV